MAEEGIRIERPLPGKEYTVVGKSGKILVHHWHVGDDIRISLYDKEGDSVYYVTNSQGAQEWAKALSLEKEGSQASFAAKRGMAEFTRVGDRFLVEGWDIYSPGNRTRAWFDEKQAKNIKVVLGVEKEKQE